MSRIHEALKKAEQDRAASQSIGLQSGIVLVSEPEPPPFAEPNASTKTAAAPANLGMPPVADPFSLETLCSRCPQGEWKPDLSTMLFMNGNDHRQGAEQYRTLRSRLYHLREKRSLKTLLVTSALPKEGKSFTATNLAQVMARQHGRSVLLIDADLRSPHLHRMLGTKSGPGLADNLQGANDEFSIMQRGRMENLFFIPAGNGIEDPAELVGNGRLKILLQRVESLFDWIIIDSPPAMPVSDASVLGKECDGVLLVVRSNVTPCEVARRVRLQFPDEALIGVVLNGVGNDPVYSRHYSDAYQKNGKRTNT
jgi:protein-tyrosine kinase